MLVANALHFTVQLCLIAAAPGCLYMILSGYLVLRFGLGKAGRRAAPVPVSVLMPLCGREPGLYSRLRALCEQDYSAPIQILCATQHSADPAIPIVRAAAGEGGRMIELMVDPRVHGRNLKISSLINMSGRARHDVLVLIDSDIEVGPDYLSRVAGELQRPGVGAVSCLYHGVAKGGLWARLAAMGIDLHFLPNVIVALRFGLAQPCFGATIAISRETLRRIGGLQAFADHLCDDYAIGEAVRALGARVAIPSFAVGHVCSERNARELLEGQLRYARTIRSIDPGGYA
jgi:ceramide glucosyltransferase